MQPLDGLCMYCAHVLARSPGCVPAPTAGPMLETRRRRCRAHLGLPLPANVERIAWPFTEVGADPPKSRSTGSAAKPGKVVEHEEEEPLVWPDEAEALGQSAPENIAGHGALTRKGGDKPLPAQTEEAPQETRSAPDAHRWHHSGQLSCTAIIYADACLVFRCHFAR